MPNGMTTERSEGTMNKELILEIPSAFKNGTEWNKQDVEASFNYMKEEWVELTDSQWAAVVTKFNAVDNQEYLSSNSYDSENIMIALDDIIEEVLSK